MLAGLAAVVAILGFVIFMKSSDSSENQGGEETSTVAEETTEEAAATATPSPTPEPITAKLVDINQVNLADYNQVRVASANASSVIQQDNGAVNNPILIFDENIETNWQEGVTGSGIGEWVQAQFSQESPVKYLTFKLGNWKTNRYYYGNNKPSKMTITMGEFSQQIQFPDEWTEFCLEFSRPCEADSLMLTIDEVYRGNELGRHLYYGYENFCRGVRHEAEENQHTGSDCTVGDRFDPGGFAGIFRCALSEYDASAPEQSGGAV